MSFQNIPRRNFLIIAAGATSFLLPLSACKQNGAKEIISATFSNADSETIYQFIERLLPIDGIESSVFNDITTGLFKSAENDSGLRESLKSCIQSLQDLTQNNWLNTETSNQISILKKLETESWFSDILSRAKASLFTHPKLWARLKYGGSSLEEGGYKYNGFDDIDWLPESPE